MSCQRGFKTLFFSSASSWYHFHSTQIKTEPSKVFQVLAKKYVHCSQTLGGNKIQELEVENGVLPCNDHKPSQLEHSDQQ